MSLKVELAKPMKLVQLERPTHFIIDDPSYLQVFPYPIRKLALLC
jgi:hypothetical protein